jgi:TRAP transporter TAXI family solute receptor
MEENNMKKVLSFSLALLMAMSLVACSPAAPATPTTEPAAPTEPAKSNLSIGTASLGGNFFTMGAAMASVIMDSTDYLVTAQATGGSAFNVTAVENGEISIGMAQASTIASAVTGTDQFKDAASKRVRTLLNYNATPVHILVKKSLNVTDINQLKGAKFECLAPGDGIETTTKKVLPLLGLPLSDVTLEYSGNRVQAASRLKTGQVDVILDATGVGAAWMADVYGKGSNFVLLDLTDEQIATISEAFPEMSKMVIPANTYGDNTKEVTTVGNWTTVFARDDMSDDVAYSIVKSIYDNKEGLVKAHSFFTDLEYANIVDAYIAPLHPGAEKFYKEVGVLK